MKHNEVAGKLTQLVECKDREKSVIIISELARYIGELQGEVMGYKMRLKNAIGEKDEQ